MSRGQLIRRILVGGLLLAVAVQLGVFFALREKRQRAKDAETATKDDVVAANTLPVPAPAPPTKMAELADAGAAGAAHVPVDAAPLRTNTELPATTNNTELPTTTNNTELPTTTNNTKLPTAPIATKDETPRQRRLRERRERREAAKEARLERERIRRERKEEERRKAEERRREEELRQAQQSPDAGIQEPPEVTKAFVTFKVSPKGARLNLDANFIGESPLRTVEISPGNHTLAASAPGYEPDSRSFSVRLKQKKTITLKLKQVVAKNDGDKGTKPVVKRPPIPRTSGSGGNAGRGRGLVGSRCNACHRARGTSRIGPRSRRRAAWSRFFAGGYHDRYERIGGLVSRGALADIRAYLMENAKCDSNAAGEKCNE